MNWFDGPADQRLVAGVWVAVLAEGVFRVGLGFGLGAYFGSYWVHAGLVGWPPIVAVLSLALVAWATQPETVEDSIGDLLRRARSVDPVAVGWRSCLLVGVAIAGHAVALVGGVVLFLLLDTPLRYVLYWAGHGDVVTFQVVVFGPLYGIGLGALVVWIVPGSVVVGLGRGNSGRHSLWTAIAAALSNSPSLGWSLFTNAVRLGVATGGFVTVVWALARFTDVGDPGPVGPIDVVAVAVVAPVAIGCVTWWLVRSFTLAADRVDRIDRERAASSDGNRTLLAVPVARLTLAVLLVTALVATAGFVRANEIRPVDATPEPLSGTPDELYATAHENTAHSSRELTSSTVDDERTFDAEVRIDREHRRIVVESDNNGDTFFQYLSQGTLHNEGMLYSGSTRAFPGYAMVGGSEVFPHEPSPDATGWTVVAEKDDRLTLELTDPDAVFDLLFYRGPDEPLDGTVHESRAEVTIDTEREVLERGEFVLNVSDSAHDRDYRVYSRFEYRMDPTVDRPAELDSPGIAERLWTVLAY